MFIFTKGIEMKQKIITIFLLSSTLISALEVGVVKETKGIVQIKRIQKIIAIKDSDKIYKGDIIITKKDSSISIRLNNGKKVILGSSRILSIDKHLEEKKNSKNYFTMNL